MYHIVMEHSESHYERVVSLLEFLRELSPTDSNEYLRYIDYLHEDSALNTTLRAG